MRTSIFLLVILLTTAAGTKAQTFNEWFHQKKTQLKYLQQQIAALEAYLQTTEQGYKIAQQGLTTITNLKQGDLDLHSAYFSSLMNVDPSLTRYPKVSAIRSAAARISTLTDEAHTLSQQLPDWSEMIDGAFTSLMNDCSKDLTWLSSLTTDGQLQMKDEERLAAIDQLYDRIQRRLQDAIRARNDITTMILNLPKK